jgi:hypothetical protein
MRVQINDKKIRRKAGEASTGTGSQRGPVYAWERMLQTRSVSQLNSWRWVFNTALCGCEKALADGLTRNQGYEWRVAAGCLKRKSGLFFMYKVRRRDLLLGWNLR